MTEKINYHINQSNGLNAWMQELKRLNRLLELKEEMAFAAATATAQQALPGPVERLKVSIFFIYLPLYSRQATDIENQLRD